MSAAETGPPVERREPRPRPTRYRTPSDGTMGKVNVTMPADLLEQIRLLALRENRSMSGMISRLCREALAPPASAP